MHTLLVIGGGFVLLGLFVLAGRAFGGGPGAVASAAGIFIPVWLAAAIANLLVGVLRAGYSVSVEAPILLVVFGAPAAAAALIWRLAQR